MAKRKKKNRNLGPRRKRMRRTARLQAAVKWRSGYGGKNERAVDRALRSTSSPRVAPVSLPPIASHPTGPIA